MRGTLLADTAPADRWEDAFPVGNGRHGALAHGRPGTESVVVTHHGLTWPDAGSAPGPGSPPGPPDLAGRLEQARDLLLAGESARALAALTPGDWYTGDGPRYHPRPFHPAFEIRVSSGSPGGLPGGSGSSFAPGSPDGSGHYRRTLNYRAGVAVARWPGRWQACFASRTRDLVVQQIRGIDPRDALVEVDPRLPGAPDGLRVRQRVQERGPAERVIVTTVEYPGAGNGGYAGVTRAAFDVASRELTLLTRVEPFAGAAGIGEARARALAAVTAVPAGDRRLLLAEHARAHAAAFGDVSLDLGASRADRRLPAGELLARQVAAVSGKASGEVSGEPVPALLEKLFDSGRYLLLSASGLLPPRLTGLWQGDWKSAWSGAITTDANLGLQLAGAMSTGVPAAAGAVADLIRRQLPDWRVNARRLFGARGIVAPAHTDGHSGLCTHFDPRWPLHLWTAAADWLLVPVLEEALARADPGYAAEHAGPALRELAEFYEDFLTRKDSAGHVVFAPSYSPENQPGSAGGEPGFISGEPGFADGEPGGWTPAAVNAWTPAAVNATMDIAAARHALRAAAALSPDPGAAGRWRALADRLPPYRLTAGGALAEWAWPPAGSGQPPLPAGDEHRHVSHLYPVWPLHEITVAGTPELAKAALLALRARGTQDGSAHGYLHKALCAARLRDGELSGRLLSALAGQGFFFRSLMSSHYPRRSVCNMDAACAIPGVLAEMLVDSVPAGQTGPGLIELLPAVPAFLPSGRLRGARTLTGASVAELCWNAVTREATATLVAAEAQEADIGCWGQAPRRVTLPAGVPVRMAWKVGDGGNTR